MPRSRPHPHPRARLSLVVAVAALLVVSTPSAAEAVGAPVAPDDPPTLSFDVDPTLPIQVDRTGGLPEQVSLVLRTTRPVDDVTVTAGGPGLQVSSYAEDTASPDRPGYVGLEVTADTGGLHALTVTASAPGATPATVRLPYVYSSGGGRLPGRDSLAGRAYVAQGEYVDYSGSESGYGGRFSRVLTFVDDTYAVRGLPGHLSTACRGSGGRAGTGCLTYSYDAETGLVQVGDSVIGQLGSGAPYFDGATPAVYRDSGEEHDGQVYRRLVLPSPGARLGGTWSYRSPYTQDGVYAQRLTLRRDGTYGLAVRAGVGYSSSYEGGPSSYVRRDWSGRYAVGDGGRLTLRDARGRTTYAVARLRIGATDSGQARGGQLGVQLEVTLKIEQGSEAGTTLTDGNLLAPV